MIPMPRWLACWLPGGLTRLLCTHDWQTVRSLFFYDDGWLVVQRCRVCRALRWWMYR